MKPGSVIASIFLLILGLWTVHLEAFEIPYPGEGGFYIGKPKAYVITADSDGDQNMGQEGIFIFGESLITIDGKEYYDSVFDSPSGESHFFLGLDPSRGNLMEKGFKLGESELIVKPSVISVNYPLSPGKSWSESNINLTATDLEIPNLGKIGFPLSTKVKVVTKVSSKTISVAAGTFKTLLVESVFSGSLLGIPMSLAQRTWLDKNNVPIKRNFEFLTPLPMLMYEIELSQLTLNPWDVNQDGIVDMSDLKIVVSHLGKRVSASTPHGIVNALDLAKVGIHFGERYN